MSLRGHMPRVSSVSPSRRRSQKRRCSVRERFYGTPKLVTITHRVRTPYIVHRTGYGPFGDGGWRHLARG
eukprot:474527-Prymnesium_polylepis.1